MRTLIFLLFHLLATTFLALSLEAQSHYQVSLTPAAQDSVQHSSQITPYPSPPVTVNHFWWFSDNYFSFAPRVKHLYRRRSTPDPSYLIATENYSNSGPPPACRAMPPLTNATNPAGNRSAILNPGEMLRLQNYRNAIPGDTLFLIVTYPAQSVDAAVLNIKIDPDFAHFFTLPTTIPDGYIPNDEYPVGHMEWMLGMDPEGLDRSMLIPLAVDQSLRSALFQPIAIEAKVVYNGQVIADDAIELLALPSHDPNMMSVEQQEDADCVIDRERFDYKVDFQNIGGGPTDSVCVKVYLDHRLDIQSLVTRGFHTPLSSCPATGACYRLKLDPDSNIATWEFPRLILLGTAQPDCLDLEHTKGFVSFSVKSYHECKMGDPVASYADIYFDENPKIQTNRAVTTCPEKLQDEEPCLIPEPKPDKPSLFWIALVIAAGAVTGLILRRLFKR